MAESRNKTLVLVCGDFHIPHRAIDIPAKFQSLLVPGKIQHVLCTGNLCTKETLDYLRTLCSDVHVVQGDFDDANLHLKEERIVTIGAFKIGLIHGHQIVPWGDNDALGIVQRRLDCDILVTGHTHQFQAYEYEGHFVVNPGSITGAYSVIGDGEIAASFVLMDIQGPRVIIYIYKYFSDGQFKVEKAEFQKPDVTQLKQCLSPTPSLIFHEYQEIEKLRNAFSSKCQMVLHQPPPPETFNRFLYENLSLDSSVATTMHLLLRRPECATDTPVLSRELNSSLFGTPYITERSIRRWISSFQDLIKNWSRLLNSQHITSQTRTSIDSAILTTASADCRRIEESRMPFDQKITQLLNIRTTLITSLQSAADDLISAVLKWFVTECYQTLSAISPSLAPQSSPTKQLPDDQTEVVRRPGKRDVTSLIMRNSVTKREVQTVHVQTKLLDRLQDLYTATKTRFERPDDEFSSFEEDTFMLLVRYHTLEGTNENEGRGFQFACPDTFFETIQRECQTDVEGFASPINCALPVYCSAFIDTDWKFGSIGSFFGIWPHVTAGSFVCNPPFQEDVMERMADSLLSKLTAPSELPIVIIIIVPNWTDSACLTKLHAHVEQSALAVESVLRRDDHSYVMHYPLIKGHGSSTPEHAPPPITPRPSDTAIYLMMNESGKNAIQCSTPKDVLSRAAQSFNSKRRS
ncbi:Vacuolar protein sorting 29 (Vps29) [Blattamonas nauphoetae]|uniref:Vacuolar protein sorting-associated protein 29 n=1 Tax=Blattamonas nauphoetae TaxID=2049346 RepID=A0ABQ9YKM9_9EUKA|nr:Vacuolar protein sorting 29 (Vps29) [Blattamonas nauphoetae]